MTLFPTYFFTSSLIILILDCCNSVLISVNVSPVSLLEFIPLLGLYLSVVPRYTTVTSWVPLVTILSSFNVYSSTLVNVIGWVFPSTVTFNCPLVILFPYTSVTFTLIVTFPAVEFNTVTLVIVSIFVALNVTDSLLVSAIISPPIYEALTVYVPFLVGMYVTLYIPSVVLVDICPTRLPVELYT